MNDPLTPPNGASLTPYAAACLPLMAPFLDEFQGIKRAQVLDELGDEFRHLALVEVRDLVASGLTWQQVGEAFGVTRQAAHERFRS